MDKQELISTHILCSRYNIEIGFVDELNRMGLIQIELIEEKPFIHNDQLNRLEKIIRLYHDLELNLEGIDVVFHLLEKEEALRKEVIELRNRLRLYEGD